MNIKQEKIKKMKIIESYEKMILNLEKWETGDEVDPYILEQFGKLKTLKQRNSWLVLLKDYIELLKKDNPDYDKLYLSEIIEKEKVIFGSNNLILAPVGSGKTTFIQELIKDEEGKLLMLVSNTALKDSISPNDNELKQERGERTYTTQNKTKHGDKKYEIHVMSYAEFGHKVMSNNNFIKDINKIFCDEIHSLPGYQQISNSVTLSHAIKTLFGKYENKQIFYFTATDEYLNNLKRRQPHIMDNVVTYDFRQHQDIKRHMILTKYKISNLDQIRPHLQSRIEGFNYFGYKCLAFNRTISGQYKIANIASDEGFKPLILWSVNNETEEFQMDKEQLKAREHLLNYGIIPDPYNFLIINSAMQEGWDLKDERVKLAIMNTTSETEYVQALGRLRKDVDVLLYKSKNNEADVLHIDLPARYSNKPLTSIEKEALCIELKIVDAKGRLLKWTSIKKILEKQGYKIKDHTKNIDGKQTRVSTINIE